MQEFINPDLLAQALAEATAAALQARLARDGAAALAVSGGTTPIKFFQALAAKNLDWPNVTITLVDDRWVPESSPRSNAALVRKHLLQGQAALAKFLPLVRDTATPEDDRAMVEQSVGALKLPFAAVVLGMGMDGHTASLLPHADRLAEALQPTQGQLVETMRAEAASEPRLTLTLPNFLQAEYLALHIEGLPKRRVLDAAFHAGPVEDMPVRAVLARDPPPEIYWSP